MVILSKKQQTENMVRKIQVNEYLKRYDNMSAAERQAFASRVGVWLQSAGRALTNRAEDFDARLHSVLSVSVGWNDAECEAFEEGARLLSALSGSADTWLPDLLYKKAVRRSIRQMVKVLSSVVGTASEQRKVKSEESAATDRQPTEKVASQSEKRNAKSEEPAEVKSASVPATTGVPIRPKHIDQYAHLLPKKTQEHAAEVRDLLRQLDDAREKARLLMESPQASPDSRAQWAKRAVQLDNKVRDIYRELDAEWEKLVNDGRITIDIFGNAHVAEIENGELKIDNSQDKVMKPELTSEQKARRRELRKWLIDTRRGAEGKAREKRIEQWKENWKEYLTLEPLEAALKDEKIVAAAKHFGIEIVDSGEFRV